MLRRMFRRGGRPTRGFSLEDYAVYLESTHWQPAINPVLTRARVPQRVEPLRGVKAVIWDVYGTLLYCHHEGESRRFLGDGPEVGLAFERTVEFFRMWPALSKSRLAPGEYVRRQFQELAGQVLVEKNVRGRRYPELRLEAVWERLLHRLQKGGYTFEAELVGPAPAFARKIALFCDESYERTTLFPGALEAVKGLADRGILQGLAGDGQVYTNAQLVKGLARAGGPRRLGGIFDPLLCCYSCEVGRHRPDPAVYQALVPRLAGRGIEPGEVLLVGNDLLHDVLLPASLGFRTALFAGSADTVRLHPDEPAAARVRPDAILIRMDQVLEVVGKG